MTKRPLGHGPFQNMRQFKAVAMDYEYYLTLGDEGQLYCLTERQVYILQVQLTYVGWLTRWYNTEDITQTTVGYIQSDLMEALMNCIDITVLVDQGKLTLTKDVQNQQIQSTGLRKIYEDRYDGDPTSINPNAPTDDFGSSGDRFDALCAALTAFVYQFAKAQAEAVIAADITAFALLAGVAILLIPGLNLFFIAGAAIALVLGGGIVGVTTAVAVASLTDTDALDLVICYMRDTLKAESVTEANWSACLDSYPFSVGSHAAIVADFIKPTLATNYLPVLDMLGQAYSGTINGDPLPECPCAPPPDREPIINSVWDAANFGGSLSGPDEDGIYTATTTLRGSGVGYGFSIMDVDGRDFVLTDIVYSTGPQCQVFVIDESPFYIACTGSNAYTGQTCDEFHTAQESSTPTTMQFKMVAP